MSGEAGEGLQGDDEQGGADGGRHGQAAEQDERRDDEEAAAGADQSGDEADGDAVRGDLGDRPLVRHRRGPGWSRRPRIIMTAVASIIRANPVSSTVAGMTAASRPPA